MDKERSRKISKVTIEGSIVNMALLLFKFTAGIIGSSSAMIADAVHSLSDFVTDIVVLLFVRLSNKPADDDHDYGHGKYETMATLIIGLVLLGIGIKIAWSAATKITGCLFHGKTLEEPGMIALMAAFLSIILKEWIYRRTMKVAAEVDSEALVANAWHHRSDALSSIGTALGIGGAIFLGKKWSILDPLAAAIVSIFIIIASIKLLIPAFGELLEKSLPKETEEKIRSITREDTLVSDIHNLRTRRIGNRIAIEMHLRMPGNISLDEAHSHVSKIEAALRKEFGPNTHIMIHFEPVK